MKPAAWNYILTVMTGHGVDVIKEDGTALTSCACEFQDGAFVLIYFFNFDVCGLRLVSSSMGINAPKFMCIILIYVSLY